MLTLIKGAASPEGELEDARLVDLSRWIVVHVDYFRITGRGLEWAYLFVSFHFIEEESQRFVGFCSIIGIYLCHLRGPRSVSCENSRSRCHRNLESTDIPRRSLSAIQLLRRRRYYTCHQGESPVDMEIVNTTPDHCSAASDRVCST